MKRNKQEDVLFEFEPYSDSVLLKVKFMRKRMDCGMEVSSEYGYRFYDFLKNCSPENLISGGSKRMEQERRVLVGGKRWII